MNIGTRKIWFYGSNSTYSRVVYRDPDGKHWIRWGRQMVEVIQADDDEWASGGWRTVEAY